MNSFEFDATKSESNRSKHSIDFVEAQSLWGDPMLLEIPANTEDEPRYLVIGLIDGKHWSAVITYRGGKHPIDIGSSRTRRRGGSFMKAKKFEQQFDADVDITASLDLSKAKRVMQEQKRVNVDFPTWMIDSLDREASKLGVTRQSVIKVWLAERLEATTSNLPFQRKRAGAAHR